jgi:hypothetical protein
MSEPTPSSEEILLSSFRTFLATLDRHSPSSKGLTYDRFAAIVSPNPPRDMTYEENTLVHNLEEQARIIVKDELESFPDETQAYDIAVALGDSRQFKRAVADAAASTETTQAVVEAMLESDDFIDRLAAAVCRRISIEPVNKSFS